MSTDTNHRIPRPTAARVEEIRKITANYFSSNATQRYHALTELLAELDAVRAELEEESKQHHAASMLFLQEQRMRQEDRDIIDTLTRERDEARVALGVIAGAVDESSESPDQ